MGGDVSVDARHRENQVKYAVSGRGNAWEKDVYICFPAIYFLPMATNISYHLPFIRKPVLDNKPAQSQIVLLLASNASSLPQSAYFELVEIVARSRQVCIQVAEALLIL